MARDMEARRQWQRENYAANKERRQEKARLSYAASKGERSAKERARWASADPEVKRRRLKRNAEYRAKNPDKVAQWKRQFSERHGDRLKIAAREGNRRRSGASKPTRPMPENCECCGKNPGKILNLDHCHETGSFRGWLCWPCNVGIGHLGDTTAAVTRALEYLKRADG